MTSATKTVSAAYLLGIRDERALLADMRRDSDDLGTDARLILANIESTMRQGYSGDMLQYMRGSRDFWRNQIRKGLV